MTLLMDKITQEMLMWMFLLYVRLTRSSSSTATIFGLVGVGLGAIAFVILAKLAKAPVAQGIVFVIIVYLFSLLKARSMKFFGTALLGILVSFAGIYTVGGIY